MDQAQNKHSSAAKIRITGYWIATGIIGLETTAGAQWDLVRNPLVTKIMGQLGYPLYLLTILGVWKILALLGLFVPRFPNVREWTYAGLFFVYTGAAASHFATNDGANAIGPLIFALLTLTSRWLGMQNRKQ
jgi:hypothetical protein